MKTNPLDPDAIVILTSGIFPYWSNLDQEISYKSTSYIHFDGFGVLGGEDRIIAAGILAKKFPLSRIITTSKSCYSNGPSNAFITKKELIELGVDASRIFLEEQSNSLRTQLQKSMEMALNFGSTSILFITSQFQTARAEMMLREIALKKYFKTKVIASESILNPTELSFKKSLNLLENDIKYKKRLNNEDRGLRALKEKSYVAASDQCKKTKSSKKALLITGTSSGLGGSILNLMLNEDVDIYSFTRDVMQEHLKISKNRDGFYLIKCNLSEISEVLLVLNKIIKCLQIYEEIIFVNNAAGILPVEKIGKLDVSQSISTINLNFVTPMLIANMLFSLESSRIKIINVTTGAAFHPIEGWSIYCSTKAGAKMFFDVLSTQIKDDNRHSVYQVDPGSIDTNMQHSIRNSDRNIFPRLDEFIAYKDSNQLKSPYEAAYKIVKDYLK